MEITFQWPSSVPHTEYSKTFIQGMLDRVAMAYHNYGAMADAYPDKVDAVASSKKRLNDYASSPLASHGGNENREWLMDAANFLMIEFKHPRHPQAYYRPTSKEESPGRKWHNELDASSRGNCES